MQIQKNRAFTRFFLAFYQANQALLFFKRQHSFASEYLIGAEDETRTRTPIQALPPQDSVSTNSTTSALSALIISENSFNFNKF